MVALPCLSQHNHPLLLPLPALVIPFSRSLGPEFGGSIGIIFFFANIFACGLYGEFLLKLTSTQPPSSFGDVAFLPGVRAAKLTPCNCVVLHLFQLLVSLKPSIRLCPASPYRTGRPTASALPCWRSVWEFAWLVQGKCATHPPPMPFRFADVAKLLTARCSAADPLRNTFGVSFCRAFAKASFIIFLVVLLSTICSLVNFFYAPENLEIRTPDLNLIENSTLAYTGFSKITLTDNIYPAFTVDYSVAKTLDAPKETISTVFGVLFNGCTGIMAGANMSGDLKNPSASIPRGTIEAAAFTFVVYVIMFIFSAGTASRDLLHNNYGYLQEINMVPGLIVMGVFAATLSAALSTLIGASRILQAISRDNLLGEWFSFFSKEKKEPIRAVFVCWFLVQMVLLIGQINVIAPIVSMLFLLSYAITNFACFVLRVTGAPNFRPRFRHFSWHTAFAGFISCVAVMFFIEPTYAAASILLMIILFSFIHVRHVPVTWGDVSQALIYHQVRKYLLRLEVQCLKYWRPQILLLVVNPRSSFSAVQFANWMKKGGLFVLGHVVVGETNNRSKEELKHQVNAWQTLDRIAKVKAFVDCVIAPTVRNGVQGLIMVTLCADPPSCVLMFPQRLSSVHSFCVPYRSCNVSVGVFVQLVGMVPILGRGMLCVFFLCLV